MQKPIIVLMDMKSIRIKQIAGSVFNEQGFNPIWTDYSVSSLLKGKCREK